MFASTGKKDVFSHKKIDNSSWKYFQKHFESTLVEEAQRTHSLRIIDFSEV